jgi:hypothetical protein
MTVRQDGIDTRLPGIALLTTSVIALGAMAQHPTAAASTPNPDVVAVEPPGNHALAEFLSA